MTISVSLRGLALMLFAALGAMQLLLWAFLGLPLAWMLGGALGLALLLWSLWRARGWDGAVSLPVVALCFAVAFAVLVLGGEGGWLYAPTDWQVRYAVLHDLASHPWPFALAHPGGALILRAPLGMYLAPGMALGIHAAMLAMLAQNTLLLGLILSLGAGIFASARARWMALGVFWAFSGMDVIGQAIAGRPLWLHLEAWAGLQSSSHITQIFWAPQHAMAGWIAAVLFALWHGGKAPARALYGALPLLALLSPLALIGAVPFAVLAFVRQVRARQWGAGDILWPALAALIAIPSLLYLTTASDAVGAGAAQAFHRGGYPLFILLELGGYFLALWVLRRDQPMGMAVTWLVVALLLVIPFGQIGDGVDFIMRASIPALAVLAIMIARVVADPRAQPAPREARRWALIMLAIGAVTPVSEIARALAWPASPELACGYLGVIPKGYSTYTARLDRVPAVIRPRHAVVIASEPAHPCWARPWPDPITGQAYLQHPY